MQCNEEEWPNPIGFLVSAFSASTEGAAVLLEILAVIPEEFYSSRYPIQKDEFFKRREAILDGNSENVLRLLTAYLDSSMTFDS